MSNGAELFLGFTGLGFFLMGLALLILVGTYVIKQKSYWYRKYLVNMYVAGRIKQLADKEKVNITEQEKNFLKYDRLSNRDRVRDLDDRIEKELSEKIGSEKESK